MAEDPLCTHTPGTLADSALLALRRSTTLTQARRRRARRSGAGPSGPRERRQARRSSVLATIEYGPESPTTIAWDEAADARMKKIPVFVRGMVIKAVEDSCRKNGLERVTVEELERIRARMPTPKIFG